MRYKSPLTVPILIFICLLLTACFQSTGTQGLPLTTSAAEASGPTVPSPTQEILPLPTNTPLEIETEEATEVATQTPVAISGRPSDALRSPTAVVIVVTSTPGDTEVVCPTCPPCELECPVQGSTAEPAPSIEPTEEPTEAPPPATLAAPSESCPVPVPEMSMVETRPSDDLRAIPQHIDFFLSDGGTVSKLREGLLKWNVLSGPDMLVEGPFDHEAGAEIAMGVRIEGIGASNVWVFNCQGTVLYQAFPNPGQRPVDLQFMELDGVTSTQELYFGLETCDPGCSVDWYGIKWIGPNPGDTLNLLGKLPVFGPNFTEPEFLGPAPSGALAIRFVEKAVVPVDGPPERDIVYTYVLTGEDHDQSYTLATKRYTEPAYRHQMLRAGDEAIGVDIQLAIDRYWDAVYNANLNLWPGESATDAYNGVNAFVRYRVMQLALLRNDRTTAQQVHRELMTLFATQPGAASVTRFADDFWKLYNDVASANLTIACDAGAELPSYEPAVQSALRYGFIRTPDDFCPF